MKRILLLFLVIGFCPLYAVIVNGYKYKRGNNILYILAYYDPMLHFTENIEQELQDSEKKINEQFEILKTKINYWNKRKSIKDIILPEGYTNDSFCNKISKELQGLEIIDPFLEVSFQNIRLFINLNDQLLHHEKIFNDVINKEQEVNFPLEIDSFLIKASKLNWKDFFKELLCLEKNFKFNDNSYKKFLSADSKLSKIKNLINILNENIEKVSSSYNKFYCLIVLDYIDIYLNNEKNNQCMIAFIETSFIEPILKELYKPVESSSNDFSNRFIMEDGIQMHNCLDPIIYTVSFFSNKYQKLKKLSPLSKNELKIFFTRLPSFEVQAYNVETTKKEGQNDEQNRNVDLDNGLEGIVIINEDQERQKKQKPQTRWEWLKNKAYAWRKALIPAVVVGAGFAARWLWLKSKNKPVSSSHHANKEETGPVAKKV